MDLVEHTEEELMIPRVSGVALGYEDLHDHEERLRAADAEQSRPTLITPCTDSLWHPRHRAESDRPDLVVISLVDCEELTEIADRLGTNPSTRTCRWRHRSRGRSNCSPGKR